MPFLRVPNCQEAPNDRRESGKERKDCHDGIGNELARVRSPGRVQHGCFKGEQGCREELVWHPLPLVDHRLAILVRQGRTPRCRIRRG
jgi:hypothetical protein